MRRGKKGQQALEYMVTYGWAFVVVIVVIGAFAYFGILSPQKYLPSRCDFGMQLQCIDYIFEADPDQSAGFIRMRFVNAFGEDIQILDVTTADGTGERCRSESVFPNCQASPPALIIGVGETSEDIVLDLGDTFESPYILAPQDKTLVPVIITFQRNVAGAPQHQLVGEVFTSGQDAS